MTKKKGKWGLILAPIAVIAVCASLIVGSTLALFTSNNTHDIAITSANVDVSAKIDENSIEVYSPKEIGTKDGEVTVTDETNVAVGNTFYNGGMASIDNKTLTISNMSAGDSVSFDILLTNASTIQIKYQTVWTMLEDSTLPAGLSITVDGIAYNGNLESFWSTWNLTDAKTKVLKVTVAMDAASTAKNAGCKLQFAVNAVQGNAKVENPEAPQVLEIHTEDQLYAFADAVNNGETFIGGKVVRLMNDFDLGGKAWTPIGCGNNPTYDRDPSFKGEFDGNGHTVSNFTVEATQYAGFFGHLAGRVHDLTISDATIKSNHYAGGIAGAVLSAVGDHAYCGATNPADSNYKKDYINTVQITNCNVEYCTIESSVWFNKDKTKTEKDENGKDVKVPDPGYDDGDKVGGIIGYLANYNHGGNYQGKGYTVKDNKVRGLSIKGYRDIGFIIGYSHVWYDGDYHTITGNKAGFTETVDGKVVTYNAGTITQNLVNGYKKEEDVLNTVGGLIGHENTKGTKPVAYVEDHGTILGATLNRWQELTEETIKADNNEFDRTLVVPENEKVTLDLSVPTSFASRSNDIEVVNYGKKIVGSNNGATIVNYGELEIIGGEIYSTNTDANGRHGIVNYGTLTVRNAKLGSKDSRGNAIRNCGTATLTNVVLDCVDNNQGKGYAYPIANSAGIMTLNNCTYEGSANGVVASDGGEIIVNSGTYTLRKPSEGSDNFWIFYVWDGKITINGGTFTRYGSDRFCGFSKGNDGMTSFEVADPKDYEEHNVFLNNGKFSREENGEMVDFIFSTSDK